MFCKQCGTNLPEGAKVCPNCGMAVEQSSRAPQQTAQTPQSTSSQASSDYQHTMNTVPAQPTQLPTVNKEFILKNINTILAVVSIILMFLPMLTINSKESLYSNNLSVSGFEIAQGMDFTDNSGTNANFFAWLMILIPIFAILTNYIKQLCSMKKITLFAAPLVCVVSLFLAKSTFASSISVSVSMALGFWLYLLLCLFWLLVGYLQYKNMPLTKDSVVSLLNQKK